MPIRLRIATFFTLLSILVLGLVCASVFYFSSIARLNTLKKRLENRAITTARLLSHAETIDRNLVRRIDSLTAIALKRKSVQVYSSNNDLDYIYSDADGDRLAVDTGVLATARDKGSYYFIQGEREAIAFSPDFEPKGFVVVSAGFDEDGRANLERLESILLFSFIGGSLLSFAGGYFFSAGLLKPVRRIANEVKAISAYNLERRIPTGQANDEWQLLASTLNELLDRLKESFELQRRFVSNASHELSTPLTLISSQLEITLQRNRTEEVYRAAMGQVLKDVRHISSLVQTLLQFATASGNPGGLHIGPVRIDEVLMRLPGQIIARDKQHSVSLDFVTLPENDDLLLVLGNEDLLFTAIMNIVSNACKYSPDHHAEVTLRAGNGVLIIEIKDAGVGIDDNELEHIFQPFYRIQQTDAIKGFGLGLSLAARIVKLHKGDITVSSVPGSGSTFVVTLPMGDHG